MTKVEAISTTEQNRSSVDRWVDPLQIELADFGNGSRAFTMAAPANHFSETLTNAEIRRRLVASLQDGLANKTGDWIDFDQVIAYESDAYNNLVELLQEAQKSSPETLRVITRFLPQQAQSGQLTLESFIEKVFPDGNGSGITTRHWHPDVATREEVMEIAIEAGVALLKSIVDARGWTDIDALYVTSAFLPLSLGQQIEKRAQERGILPKYDQSTTSDDRRKVRELRMYCGGSAVALAAALSDPEIKDKHRVAILSLEPLADLLRIGDNSHMFSLGNLKLLSIFGNDYVGLGFNPSEYRLKEGSKAEYVDDNGIMAVAPWYDQLNDMGLPKELQAIFSTTSDQIRDISTFQAGRFSATVLNPDADNGKTAIMQAREVRDFFVLHVPRIIGEVLAANPEIAPGALFMLNHEASWPVIEKVAAKVTELFASRDTDGDWMGLLFTLSEVENMLQLAISNSANSSSATIMRQMHTLAKNHKYPSVVAEHGNLDSVEAVWFEKELLMIIAMAIGSIITALVIEPRQQTQR